ncbi:MAG: hypothetical protein AB4426_08610 [Xenococcaceae cyanobacterium]
MNIEQAVLENLRELPTDKQQEVLEFTEFLRQNTKSVYLQKKTNTTQLTPQEKAERWRKFVASLPKNSANLPEEALHRDTIYYE